MTRLPEQRSEETQPAGPCGRAMGPGWRRDLALIVLIILLGAAVRFFSLADDNLWADEGLCALAAGRGSIGEVVTTVITEDNHPPLYYVLLHLWRRVAGSSDWALRAFSALLGTLTIPLVFAVARRLVGGPGALWAAVFAALSPISVHFSQEARMYALLTLLLALIWYFGLRLRHEGDAAAIWGFMLVAVVLPYVHFYGAPVLVAVLLVTGAVLWRDSSARPRLKWLVLSGLASAVAFAPWLWVLLRYQLEFATRLPHLSAKPGVVSLAGAFGRFFGPKLDMDAVGVAAGGTVALALALFGVLALSRGPNGRRQIDVETTWWCLGPVIVAVGLIAAIGLITPFWVGLRIPAVTVVPLAVVFGVAVPAAWRRGWQLPAVAIAALVLSQCALGIWRIHDHPTRPNWTAMADLLAAQERPGDVVFLADEHWARPLFERYYCGSLPVHGLSRSMTDRAAVRAAVEPHWGQNGRAWLVIYHIGLNSTIQSVMGEMASGSTTYIMRGYSVVLYRR